MSLYLSSLYNKNPVLEIFPLKIETGSSIEMSLIKRSLDPFESVYCADTRSLLRDLHPIVLDAQVDKTSIIFLSQISSKETIKAMFCFYQNLVILKQTWSDHKVSWLFDRIRLWLNPPVLLLKTVNPAIPGYSLFGESSLICGYQAHFYLQFLSHKFVPNINMARVLNSQNTFIVKKEERVYLDHFLDLGVCRDVVKQQLYLMDAVISHHFIPKELIDHIFGRLKDAKNLYLEHFLEETKQDDSSSIGLYRFLIKQELISRGKSIALSAEEKLYEACFSQDSTYQEALGIFPDLKVRKIVAMLIPKKALSEQPSFLRPKDEKELEEYLRSFGPFYYLGLLEILKTKKHQSLIEKHGLILKKIEPMFLKSLFSFALKEGAFDFLKNLCDQMQDASFFAIKKDHLASFLISMRLVTYEILFAFFDISYLDALDNKDFMSLVSKAFFYSRWEFLLYLILMKEMSDSDHFKIVHHTIISKNYRLLKALFSLPLDFFQKKANLLALEEKFRRAADGEAIAELIQICPEAAKTATEVLKLPEKGFEAFFETCPKNLFKAYLMRTIELKKEKQFQYVLQKHHRQIAPLDKVELLGYAITKKVENCIPLILRYLDISIPHYRALFLKFIKAFNTISSPFLTHSFFSSMSILEKKAFLSFLLKHIEMTNKSFALMFIKKAITEEEILGNKDSEGLFNLFIQERHIEGVYIHKHASCVTQDRWDDFFEEFLLKRNFLALAKKKIEVVHGLSRVDSDRIISLFIEGVLTTDHKKLVTDLIDQEKKADIKFLQKFAMPHFPKISDKKAVTLYQQIQSLNDEEASEVSLAIRHPKKDLMVLFNQLIPIYLLDGEKSPIGLERRKKAGYRGRLVPKSPLVKNSFSGSSLKL